jgi:hypothetical protein
MVSPGVADRIDAAMHGVQPPATHPAGDPVLRQAASAELGHGEHAPLSRRPLRDGRVG